jgi:hypothetical protein
MWRAMFLALGTYAVICGAECLMIEKAVLKSRHESASGGFRAPMMGRSKEFIPPEWAPWSLLSGGAVTVLYSFTLPRRGDKK